MADRRESAAEIARRMAAPSPDAASRLGLVEARVLAYLAWCCASRRQVSRVQIGQVRGENGQPIGARRARQICEDLHDSGMVALAGWVQAGDSVPMTVLMHQTTVPSIPLVRDKRRGGAPVGGGFLADGRVPPVLLAELTLLYESMLEMQKVPTGDRDADWIQQMGVVAGRRAAAFYQWSAVDPTPSIRREADRLEESARTLRQQAAARRTRDTRRE